MAESPLLAWLGPGASQKLLAIGLLAASLVAAGYGFVVLRSEEQKILYHDLEEEEAARAVDRLKTADIEASLGKDGRSVRVKPEQVDEARLVLAGEGIPSRGRVGFEIFDKTNLAMTDFMQQVNYRRALEGELARTISAMEEVSQARVHLVMPRESLYSEEQKPAKASVALTLRRGMRPDRKEVAAIVHLVSSAVPGLDAENVVVVDNSGRTLHQVDAGATSGGPVSESQLQLQGQVEQELSGKAIAILEPIVGDGRVRASASVEIAFDQAEETEERFNPDASVVRSQQKTEEQRFIPDKNRTSGVPGTRSNPPDTGQPAATTLASDRSVVEEKKSETINYEVSKTVRRTSTPMGRVKRRSVAVVVDDLSTMEPAAPTDAVLDATAAPPVAMVEKRTPRTADEMQKFRDLVTAALGLNTEAGDLVTVENVSFDVSKEPTLAPESTLQVIQRNVSPYGRNMVYVGVAFLLYLFMFRPLMRRIVEPPRQLVAASTRALPEGALGMPLAAANAQQRALEAETDAELLRRVQAITRDEPENASRLVRNWLKEDEA